MHKTINSSELKKMILIGAKQLELNRAKVDALNVFPVPDGDTGTNMSLTMQSAVKEMTACQSSAFPEVCDSISKGALKGARGNSGVLLSQILKGLCAVIRKAEKEVAKYENEIAEIESKIAEIEDELSKGEAVDSSVYTKHADLQKQLENAMSMWELACEEVEKLRS